jgi:hypothetical protein
MNNKLENQNPYGCARLTIQGNSRRKVMYSDCTCLNALPNPVISDSDGIFPNIFVKLSDASYKVELRSSKGVRLYSRIFQEKQFTFGLFKDVS